MIAEVARRASSLPRLQTPPPLTGLPPRARAALVALALLALVVLAYLLVVAPKRSESERLAREIESVRQTIVQQRATLGTSRPAGVAQPAQTIERASVADLPKGMPDQVDLPSVLLQIDQLARRSGLAVTALEPQAPVASGTFGAIPVRATFEGRFLDLTAFLTRLEQLVRVRRGKLDASGRLFVVDRLDLREGAGGFPQLQASLTLAAFHASGGSTAGVAAPGAPTSPQTAPTPTPAGAPAPTPTVPAASAPATVPPGATDPPSQPGETASPPATSAPSPPASSPATSAPSPAASADSGQQPTGTSAPASTPPAPPSGAPPVPPGAAPLP